MRAAVTLDRYLSRATLEQIGEEITEACFGSDTPPDAVDLEVLTRDFLRLEVRYAALAPYGLLGFTSFTDARIGKPDGSETLVEAGVIYVSTALLAPNADGRRRFTIAHEAAHQVVHRLVGEESEKAAFLRERGAEPLPARRVLQTPGDWREWQADTLAAALLMPEGRMRSVLHRYHPEGPMTRYGSRLNHHDIAALWACADRMRVSHTACARRMEGLGLIRRRPAHEYQESIDVFPEEGELM